MVHERGRRQGQRVARHERQRVAVVDRRDRDRSRTATAARRRGSARARRAARGRRCRSNRTGAGPVRRPRRSPRRATTARPALTPDRPEVIWCSRIAIAGAGGRVVVRLAEPRRVAAPQAQRVRRAVVGRDVGRDVAQGADAGGEPVDGSRAAGQPQVPLGDGDPFDRGVSELAPEPGRHVSAHETRWSRGIPEDVTRTLATAARRRCRTGGPTGRRRRRAARRGRRSGR